MPYVEYRVRPVTRFVVTSFEADGKPEGDPTANLSVASRGASRFHGEFDNFPTAYAVGYALCKQRHEELGYPAFDERVKYPAPMGETEKQTHYNPPPVSSAWLAEQQAKE